MDTAKIVQIPRSDTHKRINWVRELHCIVVVAVISSFICVPSVSAQKILLETGFENDVNPDWAGVFQPTPKIAKNGHNSLEIFAEPHQLHAMGHGFKTDEPIVSVEFYVYVEIGEQSFGVRIGNNTGGPYVEWHGGDIRYHVHRGDPWRKIAAYPVNKWHYVRIVANFEKDTFDFYMGKNREAVLDARPKRNLEFSKRNLEFQAPANAPRPKWFQILAWEMEARGYMDDLLVYEGETPIALAVEPKAKLTTLWGRLKRE